MLLEAVRHRPPLSTSIQRTNRPTPTRDELPCGVRPRTLKIEPSRKIAAATKPTTPSQRQTRLVRWIARERTATKAVMVQTIGGVALQLIKGEDSRGLVAVGHPDQGGLGGVRHKPIATQTPPLMAMATARVSCPDRQMTGPARPGTRAGRMAMPS
jgi:hypothetical protein